MWRHGLSMVRALGRRRTTSRSQRMKRRFFGSLRADTNDAIGVALSIELGRAQTLRTSAMSKGLCLAARPLFDMLWREGG